MPTAWLLPEHIADVLPSQARRLETLRRTLLDAARGYGYSMVVPPMLEHLESLLSGASRELDLRTFKLVDQTSGRSLGIRADMTPQVARIDAHLLNRPGVVRLCYCGPVLHARPVGMRSSREPLQFGAEIYGQQGPQADLEVQDLAIDCLRLGGVGDLIIDMGDVRIVESLLAGSDLSAGQRADLHAALEDKDPEAVANATRTLAPGRREALSALVRLYGEPRVLDEARRVLPDDPAIRRSLDDLAWFATHLAATHPEVTVGIDLASVSGFGYYTGPSFAVYARGASDALLRGGRYDAIGAAFGRRRDAVGFSLDLKDIAALQPGNGMPGAIRAPWQEEGALRAAIRRLRDAGEVVVCEARPGDAADGDFEFDRELVEVAGQWVVRSL
ncbi:MAG: ATP phosphoribosyltransferase regulatory subunit [Ideonella sp.]|jgi:ATP phosphoribosyltransferase regulatory subunit|nr:ATP phosphoribosyltransferase regulatory subunit [Ideonella sp.]